MWILKLVFQRQRDKTDQPLLVYSNNGGFLQETGRDMITAPAFEL